jgi:hypothetical protein
VLRGDDDPVGWVHDRLVLLVPVHAVVLVLIAAEQLDDLSASRRLAVHTTRLDPVADVCAAWCLRCHGDSIQPFGCDAGIGVGR